MTNILIVDDHPLMRKGLALTLNEAMDLNVTEQAESAEEALEILEKNDLDLIIVDISLPGMGGLEFIKCVRAVEPKMLCLVVSRHDEALYAERAIRAGARGYVMKLEAGDVIVDAVRRVVGGGIYVSEEINERLLISMVSGHDSLSNSPLDVLSDRELEVFEMIGRGISTREIAEKLHLSVKTVESYRSRIKDKLNLKSASELIQHGVQWIEGERGT